MWNLLLHWNLLFQVSKIPAGVYEKTWVLLQNDYKDVLDKNGKVKYRIKECVDDFHYVITDPATGRKTQ